MGMILETSVERVLNARTNNRKHATHDREASHNDEMSGQLRFPG
jgi:hypothetical protein